MIRRSLFLFALALVAVATACLPAPTGPPLLRDVRMGVHPGFDRVVLEFDGGIPAVATTLTSSPVIEDPSGRELDVAGEAVLLVRLEPAFGYDPETGAPAYEGEHRMALPSGGVVTEVVLVGDFEGVITWAVGLRHPVDPVVRTATDPSRVVVDLPT